MEIQKKVYSAVNITPETKRRIYEIYYKLKLQKNFKNVDQFMNYLLDSYEK